MEKEILRVVAECWNKYCDEKYGDEQSFKDFMRFLCDQIY